MKNRNETVLKMLRYRADVEDRSFLRVMMRQLTDSVIGHDRDTEGLIVDLLDNQITMQDMIVRSCGMMSMYADRLDMDSTRRLITYLEWRGDYRDTNYTGIVDMYGYVQTRWDDLADYVSHTAGETIARAFPCPYVDCIGSIFTKVLQYIAFWRVWWMYMACMTVATTGMHVVRYHG